MSKVYEVITSQIVEQLEQGVVPWARPWKVNGLAPSNLLSRRPYRGINVFLLGFRAASTPWWLTFRQAKALGGAIRAGERSTPVIFWRWVDRSGRESAAKDANEGSSAPRSERLPVLRYYSVFNLDQTEGIDPSKIPAADSVAIAPVQTAEEIVAGFPVPPTIEHRAQPRAFYRPATDSVTMPPRSAFDRTAGYYSTLFHELTHATGHTKRLARPGFDKNHAAPFGSEPYAREGLVAELGAAFLCGEAGIEPDIPNSAAYIDHWRQNLSRDSRLVITAAQQAQRAADYILGRATKALEESAAQSEEPAGDEQAA
ncbi:MAG: ArdC family protein [Thermoanaerobaculia bacterium]